MTEDWVNAISHAMDEAEGGPITWGQTDCLMWIANIHMIVTGVDPAKPYRFRYFSQEAAVKLMGRRGVLGVLLETARRMAWPRIDPDQAKIGDVGVVRTIEGAAGVIRGPKHFHGRVNCGWSAYDATIVAGAWSVDPCHR